MKTVLRFIVLALALACGVAAAQGPAFTQQYMQRLGGHLDEARIWLATLLVADASEDLKERARNRVAALEDSRERLTAADPFTRPLVLVAVFDPDIAEAAWHDFEPAVPANAVGVAYGGAGAAVLLALAAGGKRLRRRATRTAAGTQP